MTLRLLVVGNDWDELDALERSFRARRGVWDVAYCCGSLDANRHLAIAEDLPEVVLATGELPTMDGFEFLKRMPERAPGALRFVVSDDVAVRVVSGSIPWVDGCLEWPLDLDGFEATVEAMRANAQEARTTALRTFTEGIEHLPPLPATYAQIVGITSRRDFALREVAEVIERDVGVTAETMRMVNSTFFALRGEITTVDQAVNLLGLDMVRGLVLANSLFTEDDDTALDRETLSNHSCDVAAVARTLAAIDGESTGRQAIAYLAGMVHSVGLLLLECNDAFDPRSLPLTDPDLEQDRAVLGVDRFSLGAYLLRMWDFEADIVLAVASLAHPDLHTTTLADAVRSATELVAIEGFPVRRFVEGDEEIRAKVALVREQWALSTAA